MNMVMRVKKDLKKLTVKELIHEKNELSKSINKVEKEYLQNSTSMEGFVFTIFSYDEDLAYKWDVEELIDVLKEILKRCKKANWLFDR
jgi:hypothetical protein